MATPVAPPPIPSAGRMMLTHANEYSSTPSVMMVHSFTVCRTDVLSMLSFFVISRCLFSYSLFRRKTNTFSDSLSKIRADIPFFERASYLCKSKLSASTVDMYADIVVPVAHGPFTFRVAEEDAARLVP